MVIGTVKGDIHDIGKNLVGMMMEGAGFEVIDPGHQQPGREVPRRAGRAKPDILGMSALLTTTMPYMKVVIDTLKERACATTTSCWSAAPAERGVRQAVGADAYCRDAGVAVETAKTLIAHAAPPR